MQRFVYRIYERQLERELDGASLPQHVGVILDGHRRYARAERLPDYAASYRRGMEKLETVIRWIAEFEIPVLTAWVLSPQNLSRPKEELEPYFEVLIELFERLPGLAQELDLGLRIIGSLDLLPDHLVEAGKRMVEARPHGHHTLNVALAYGGREEIVDAARDLVADLARQGIDPMELAEHIDADALAEHMYSAGQPDPDLLIRTSGESRLSGFLLWHSTYAEFAFIDAYWPAFRRIDFLRSLRDYSLRERRYGR